MVNSFMKNRILGGRRKDIYVYICFVCVYVCVSVCVSNVLML